MKTAIFIFFLNLILITGCTKEPKVQTFFEKKSIITTFKTEKLKYSDAGFLHKGNQKVKIEIFSLSVPALVLELTKDRVCVNAKCLNYVDFNKEFLSQYYPEKIIQDIFLMRPIFKGRNISSTENGFVQVIEQENSYKIKYSVSTENEVFFKDSLNKILIKIRES